MKKVIKVIAAGSFLATLTLFASEVTDIKLTNINKNASDAKRIAKENLGTQKELTELALGLRKTDLYSEEDDTVGHKTDFDRPAPGSSIRFERAFTNAPPMIPHSVDGLLPITTGNNQCVNCHMPAVAESMGATPLPKSHFTDYRPKTAIGKSGKITKEGKDVDNTSDHLTAAHTLENMSNTRFNCSQCHAPQSKGGTAVANTFRSDFGSDDEKSTSNLADVINQGVKVDL